MRACVFLCIYVFVYLCIHFSLHLLIQSYIHLCIHLCFQPECEEGLSMLLPSLVFVILVNFVGRNGEANVVNRDYLHLRNNYGRTQLSHLTYICRYQNCQVLPVKKTNISKIVFFSSSHHGDGMTEKTVTSVPFPSCCVGGTHVRITAMICLAFVS